MKKSNRRPIERTSCEQLAIVCLLLVAGSFGATALAAQTLDSVSPEIQSVHGMVVLRGSGFGTYSPGDSQVSFQSPGGSVVIAGNNPYVWRDDYIQIRVPAGSDGNTIPLTELEIVVETAGGNSNAVDFQVLTRTANPLNFVERSRIVGDEDITGFLGDVDNNKARTKDADIADVNGDGYPDMIDNNSNNDTNNTHAILRLNQNGESFEDFLWEPINSSDNGNFVVTIPNGGNYVGGSIVYDADFVDLNNDELPEWVQAESGANLRLRVIENNFQGVPGNFVEATDTWLPNQNAPGSPDDVSHADLNYDGFVDVITSYRFSNDIDVYLNDGGQDFESNIRLSGTGSVSFHDAFILDANADGYPDIIGVNENNDCQLFIHNTNLSNPNWVKTQDFNDDAHAGIAGDFNADGFDDFALTKFDKAAVYINNPNNPGNFTRFNLPDPQDFIYDVEPGDVDLDGDIDLIGASVILNGNADNSARIWINSGNGTSWTTWSDASDILPGIGGYQRLSADLIDFDLDGDSDFYLTGSDGSGPWGFGMSPNQFWENTMLGMSLKVSGSCPGNATLSLRAAAASGTIALFGSTSLGSTNVGGPCANQNLDLANGSLLTLLTSDSNGEISLELDIPDSGCDFILQAVDAADCSVSNFAVIH